MIAHKHITKIIAVIMALAVCLCLVAVAFSDQIKAVAGDTGVPWNTRQHCLTRTA